MEELKPYQETTIEFIREHPRCCVNNSAGLGKSRCAIDALDYSDRVLVVCPAHLRENWEREILKWRPTMRVMFDIRSYDFFGRAKDKLSLPAYSCAIVDESTYLKSWSAMRTMVLCRIVLPRIRKIVFMSASPLQKAATDLHPTLSLLNERAAGDISYFEKRYCNEEYDYYKGRVYRGVKQETAAELKALWAQYSIKFTKDMVEKQLPPIMEEFVHLTPKKKPDYDPATLDFEHVTAAMKTAYQVNGMEKVGYVMDFIDSSEQEPTLIFTHHRRVNEEYVAALKKAGYRVGSILGGEPNKDAIAQAFERDELDYLVMSIAASATGLNLPRAKRVLFAELPWTYVDYMQAMNRAHRLTTKHTVYVHSFVLSGTIDEALLAAVLSKKNMSDIVIGNINTTIEVINDGKTKDTDNSTSTRLIANTESGAALADFGTERTPWERTRTGDFIRRGDRCDTDKSKSSGASTDGRLTESANRSTDGRPGASTGRGGLTERPSSTGSDPLGLTYHRPIDDPLGISIGNERTTRSETSEAQATNKSRDRTRETSSINTAVASDVHGSSGIDAAIADYWDTSTSSVCSTDTSSSGKGACEAKPIFKSPMDELFG